MDFRNVTGLTIPTGSVNKISIGGVVVWSKNDGRYEIMKDGEVIDRITISDLVDKVQDCSAQEDYGIGAQIIVPYHDSWDDKDYRLPFDFVSFTAAGEGTVVLQSHYAIPTTALVYCQRTSSTSSYCKFEQSSIFKWLNSHETEHNLSATSYENKTGFLDCLPQDFVDVMLTNTVTVSNVNYDCKFYVPHPNNYNAANVNSSWEYWVQKVNNTQSLWNTLNTTNNAWKIYCIHDHQTASPIMTNAWGSSNNYYYMFSFTAAGKFVHQGGDTLYRYQPYCIIE